ncbi:MAG: hypothetical protein V4489_02660 [Chlamydiota bacterium]
MDELFQNPRLQEARAPWEDANLNDGRALRWSAAWEKRKTETKKTSNEITWWRKVLQDPIKAYKGFGYKFTPESKEPSVVWIK